MTRALGTPHRGQTIPAEVRLAMNASYKRLDRIKCETMQESFSILDFYSRQEPHSYRPEPKFRAAALG
jgi:hypothetical protein